MAALKTFRRDDDAWGGANGDVALREETTHSVLFEAMVKWGSHAFLTQSLQSRAARVVDATCARGGGCGSGAILGVDAAVGGVDGAAAKRPAVAADAERGVSAVLQADAGDGVEIGGILDVGKRRANARNSGCYFCW